MRANYENEPRFTINNDLAEKFDKDFSQNFNNHSLTIVLPWQQLMSDETNLYLK